MNSNIVVDSDPLRLVGFRALLESDPDFEFIIAIASIPDLNRHGHIDIICWVTARSELVW